MSPIRMVSLASYMPGSDSPGCEHSRTEFFFSSRRRHTICGRDWSSDVCSSDLLAQVADHTVKTMHEVIEIEREVAAGDREREAKLAAIRDRLVRGMQGVNAAAIEK